MSTMSAPLATPETSSAAHIDRHGHTIYPLTAKILHWAIAIFVCLQIASGVLMTQIGGGAFGDQLYKIHKAAGALALIVIAVRLSYRFITRLAGRWYPEAGNWVVHRLLYGVLIAIPLLGWLGISDFGARTLWFGYSLPAIWPKGAGYADSFFTAHAYLAFGLLALVVIHIGMALDTYIHRRAAGRPKHEL
jgi:cytochrome b561